MNCSKPNGSIETELVSGGALSKKNLPALSHMQGNIVDRTI